jgi:hypothetical protein
MVSLTCLTIVLLEMLLVEDGIDDAVAFATGGRKSSKITRPQAAVLGHQKEEFSWQSAKMVSRCGSHVGETSQATMCRGGRVQDR